MVRYTWADLGGATRPGPPPYFYLYEIFLEPYIFPHYANTCLKIRSCIDLKCLPYVWVTVKIQFANTVLNHTHLLLGRNASSHVRPPFKISESVTDMGLISLYCAINGKNFKVTP